MAIVNANGISYFIEDDLKKRWDKIKNGQLIKKDEDRAYIVDGREGTGKSVFTFQQASYLDPTFSKNIKERICFTPESFLKAIRTAPRGSVIVFDEAFRGLSSRAALSKVNKQIIQALMEMRQRNLIIFIVLPSFFLLDIYPAMLRSNCLFHIYKGKKTGRRGYLRAYNYKKKATLYQIGLKKGWSYGKPYIKKSGRFYGKYTIDEQLYRKMKYDALKETDLEKKEEYNKWEVRAYKIIGLLKNATNWSENTMEKHFIEHDIDLKRTQIGNIVRDARKMPKILRPLIY